jgi:hypothetical protein
LNRNCAGSRDWSGTFESERDRPCLISMRNQMQICPPVLRAPARSSSRQTSPRIDELPQLRRPSPRPGRSGRAQTRSIVSMPRCRKPLLPAQGSTTLRERRRAAGSDLGAHDPPPLRDLPYRREAVVRIQVLRSCVQIGATSRRPALRGSLNAFAAKPAVPVGRPGHIVQDCGGVMTTTRLYPNTLSRPQPARATRAKQ